MHKPRLTRVPDAFFQASLHIPVLKTKFVVYQVWNCPGFYMYLSNRCALLSGPLFSFIPRIHNMLFPLASEQVTIGLRANVNTPASSGSDNRPSPPYSWFAEGTAGVRQHAYRADAVYTPLYCMRFIRKPLLRRDEKPQGPEK
jgi:hypothetical protein